MKNQDTCNPDRENMGVSIFGPDIPVLEVRTPSSSERSLPLRHPRVHLWTR